MLPLLLQSGLQDDHRTALVQHGVLRRASFPAKLGGNGEALIVTGILTSMVGLGCTRVRGDCSSCALDVLLHLPPSTPCPTTHIIFAVQVLHTAWATALVCAGALVDQLQRAPQQLREQGRCLCRQADPARVLVVQQQTLWAVALKEATPCMKVGVSVCYVLVGTLAPQ